MKLIYNDCKYTFLRFGMIAKDQINGLQNYTGDPRLLKRRNQAMSAL